MKRESSQQENENQKLKQEIITGLRRLKTDYKDGVPDEIIHSTSKDTNQKVRKGWFQEIVGEMYKIIIQHEKGEALISEELFDELNSYNRKLTSQNDPFKKRPTEQNDIDEAEEMIDKFIAGLEK